jgi:hypothetical protein
MAHYNNEIKEQAKLLYNKHKNYNKVGRILGASGETVRTWCNDGLAEKYRNYTRSNKKKLKQYNKEYYKKTKSKRSTYHKKYYEEHYEKIKEWTRTYKNDRWNNDPNFRIRLICADRIRKVLKTKNKSKTTFELIGCTPAYLKEHIEKQFKHGMSWSNHGEWHIDHIIPCASFDLTKIEEQKKCFHYSNLQPLWKHENLSKADKIV